MPAMLIAKMMKSSRGLLPTVLKAPGGLRSLKLLSQNLAII